MANFLKLDMDQLKTIASSLLWLNSVNDPHKVFKMIATEALNGIESELQVSSIKKLADDINVSFSVLCPAFYSLIRLHQLVGKETCSPTELSTIFAGFGFNEEVANILTNFICERILIIEHIGRGSLSQYPVLRSISCRFQISIGRMTLHKYPSVSIQMRLNFDSETRTVILSSSMLDQISEELQHLLAQALRLDRISSNKALALLP
ncbi:unnamed protein product [Dracunculus medinensis]|uniref:COMM domain-containing protein n=1 Tax=Dracunculus medinensis TaxID=318479 RepID=A0A0N4U687_DRAME|nr:unnamed protein product [Dracunculus medinensis]